MKTLHLIATSGFLVIIGVSVGLISYSYLNYAQMTIVRLDRTLLGASVKSINFVDISYNITTIQKLQESINKVENKYDSILKKCNNNNATRGYCDELPINAIFTTVISANEFQTINKTVQLKPLGISGNDTWFSTLKYRHEGCFPPAHGFQLDSSISDDYCYYNIIIERR